MAEQRYQAVLAVISDGATVTEVAARFGLPLTIVDTGTSRLERELEALIAGDGLWSLAQRPQKSVSAVPTTTNDVGRRRAPGTAARHPAPWP